MAYIIDQKNCSGCHRCRVECPQSAITFRNDKYWINPEKCISCGICADVCHNECISNPDAPAKTVVPHEKVVMECDVVVVGGGGAGMVCAARAAENGAKVIVLEKGKEVGGSADYAHQIKVHYSKWHAEKGLPDERDKTYEEFVRKTGGKVNPKLIRRVLDANVELFDWLIEEHDFGKDFKLDKGGLFNQMGLVSKYIEPMNDNRVDTMIGPGGHGWWMCRKNLSILEENGGKVLYHTPAKHLLTDESGAICGVLAQDEGGEVEIRCKAVAVTAGAFTRNEEIMDKMQPLFKGKEGDMPVHIFTCSHCTGDGLVMCEEIGAEIDYVNRRVNMMGPMRHPYPAVTLNAFSRDLMVNIEGDHYDPKLSFSEMSTVVDQPKRYVWSIVDSKVLKENIEGAMHNEHPDCVNIDLDKFLVRWPEVMREEEESGSVMIADTIEALAEKLGIDPAKLVNTVNTYNAKLNAPAAPMGAPGGMPPMGEGMPPMGAPGGMPPMGEGMPPMGAPGGMPPMGEGMPPMGAPGGMPPMGEGMPPMGAPGGMPGMQPPQGMEPPKPEEDDAPLFDFSALFGDGEMPPMMKKSPVEVGPFYAIRLKMFHENAIGGMTIDENTAVLRPDGTPIPGLFAAGDNTRGIMLPGDIGAGYIEQVITALTFALTSGYIAGQETSKYAAAH